MRFLGKPSFLFGIVYYILVSLAIIFFASPLFRVLGFEYSGFIAIASSLHLLYYAAEFAAERKDAGAWKVIKGMWLSVLILANIPLLVSILSAFIIPNCSLWDGLIFYFEIVYPTALIAIICGAWFGIAALSKWKMNISLALFWVVTFIISLLPGYFSARIYTYGWQYGYFPGLVWDEAMELSAGYWISRLVELGVIFSWLLHHQAVLKEGGYSKEHLIRRYATWQYWLFIAGCGVIGYVFFIQTSDTKLESFFTKGMNVNGIHLHFASNEFTNDELLLVRYNVREYAKEIDSIYGLRDHSRTDVYIFPTSDDLYEFVGTREASISKPWKRSIYMTKQNLNSLKHEMTHVMLSDYGSFPFDISWSTGLTEGAAVAVEDDYDGIRDCDEYAARIIQMGLSKGVKNVMSFSGFASEASGKSYVLAGSFSKYLIKNYGIAKFLECYHSRNFYEAYGATIDTLEKRWINSLNPLRLSLSQFDSTRIRFYFDRHSILKDPCLRRIGKIMKAANELFSAKQYAEADSLYAIVLKESDRLDAVRGRVLSKLRMNDPSAALRLLDTLPAATKTSAAVALHMLRGDVAILAGGNLSEALNEWVYMIGLELSDRSFLAAFAKSYCFGSVADSAEIKKYIAFSYAERSSEFAKARIEILQNLKPKLKIETEPDFEITRNYLLYSEFNANGDLRNVLHSLQEIRRIFDARGSVRDKLSMNLFEDLTNKKRERLEKVFGTTRQ